MHRVFVALELPVLQRRSLRLLCEECPDSGTFRWEPEEKLHLTLKFIGDIDDKTVAELTRSLPNLQGRAAPVTQFTGLGFFGKPAAPSILQVGLLNTPILQEVCDDVESCCLETMGLPRETRKFHPHITLLRIKPYHNLKALQNFAGAELNKDKFNLSGLVLYESKLHRSGSVYSPIVSYQLKS
jgi:2'-5' RNA ligase